MSCMRLLCRWSPSFLEALFATLPYTIFRLFNLSQFNLRCQASMKVRVCMMDG